MSMLRVFAILFGLLAVSNLLKPLELSGEHGFVFFGRRLSGVPNALASLTFATFLAFYDRALWQRNATALAFAIAYAGWVSVNMALFNMRSPDLAATSSLFGLTYVTVAAGVSLAAVAAIWREGLAAHSAPHETLLKSFALLFGLMALSNILKCFAYTETTGFVLFGARTTGMTNVVASTVFAAFLLVYAISIWMEKRRALPLGCTYAAYVAANLVLWNFRKPEGAETSLAFGIGYLAIALGISGGAATLLYKVRDRLT